MTLKEAILKAKETHEYLFGLSENQLLNTMPKDKIPKAFDNRLRVNFWRQQNPEDAFMGVCGREVFEKYISDPFKLAYLLCEPANYQVKVSETIDLGLDQMREILLLPNVDDNGAPNSKLIANKLNIFKHLDERAFGMATQNYNYNLNTQQSNKPNLQLSHNMSEDDLMAKLREVQALETIPVVSRAVSDRESQDG